MPHPPKARARGFTAIEVVIALAVSAIVMAGMTMWLSRPFELLAESHRQAAAADQAGRVFDQLARELTQALPNSARVACGGRCLEFVPVRATGHYRTGAPGNTLDFALADDRFDVLRPLAAATSAGQLLVINNLDAAATGTTSVYSADAVNNRATLVTGTGSNQLRFTAKQFPAPSPAQRFYVVATPVSYLCAPQASGGSVRRYAGYALQPVQPANTNLGDLVAGRVLDCRFDVLAGGVVAVRLSVGDGDGAPVGAFSQVAPRYTP